MAKRKKMNPEYKIIWLKALRSGNYVQGYGDLLTKTPGRQKNEYCCLGVLAKKVPEIENCMTRSLQEASYLSKPALEKAGFTSRTQDKLADLNDNKGYSFREIADWIEDNL